MGNVSFTHLRIYKHPRRCSTFLFETRGTKRKVLKRKMPFWGVSLTAASAKAYSALTRAHCRGGLAGCGANTPLNNNLRLYYTSFPPLVSMSRINEFLSKINLRDKKAIKFSKSVDFFSFLIYNLLVISYTVVVS